MSSVAKLVTELTLWKRGLFSRAYNGVIDEKYQHFIASLSFASSKG
jgi:hypothetical protein